MAVFEAAAACGLWKTDTGIIPFGQGSGAPVGVVKFRESQIKKGLALLASPFFLLVESYLIVPFRPEGKKTPFAGLTAAEPLMAPPPVTMFRTCAVLRAKAMALASASTIVLAD